MARPGMKARGSAAANSDGGAFLAACPLPPRSAQSQTQRQSIEASMKLLRNLSFRGTKHTSTEMISKLHRPGLNVKGETNNKKHFSQASIMQLNVLIDLLKLPWLTCNAACAGCHMYAYTCLSRQENAAMS